MNIRYQNFISLVDSLLCSARMEAVEKKHEHTWLVKSSLKQENEHYQLPIFCHYSHQ